MREELKNIHDNIIRTGTQLRTLQHGQTDQDLRDVAKSYNIELNDVNFIDIVFSKDLEEGNYIINLAASKDGSGGTHWCAFVFKNNKLFYFDAFGYKPPEIIISYCRHKSINIYFNMNQIQNLKEEYCGIYCIAYLLEVKLFKTFNDKKDFNLVLERMKGIKIVW